MNYPGTASISVRINKNTNIIIDPGIGFGKTREDNFEIIRRIEGLYVLGCPVMLGISLAVNKKVDFLRVHNVKLNKILFEIGGNV